MCDMDDNGGLFHNSNYRDIDIDRISIPTTDYTTTTRWPQKKLFTSAVKVLSFRESLLRR
jgi:hypothetical protein